MTEQAAEPNAKARTNRAGEVVRHKPQSLVLAFLGRFVLGRGVRVFSGSFIDVFARLGVSEQAVRSTLSRMANRGLLDRKRSGRRVYFGLTPRCVDILVEGVDVSGTRMWSTSTTTNGGPCCRSPFPSPGSAAPRLAYSAVVGGLWPLRSGLWVAPSEVDTSSIVDELGLAEHVHVFRAQPAPHTDAVRIVNEAYDIEGLASGYRSFLERWDVPDPVPEAPDDLARLLLLIAEWMRLVRTDPRLPLVHLPSDWPAVPAQKLVNDLHDAYQGTATEIIDEILDCIPA